MISGTPPYIAPELIAGAEPDGRADLFALGMVLFMGLGCFIAFYFYLGKALRHLDPSKAIPGRVRSALDTMAEGLLVSIHGNSPARRPRRSSGDLSNMAANA